MKRYFGYKNSDKAGFTLAEVLITVGVIGVVAAMTIPTLMLDYQRKVWEARLKKAFSVTVNACERMLVEENVSASNETALYGADTSNAANTNDAIRKYFKILRDGSLDPASEGGTSRGFLIALPDGADLYYSANSTLPGFKFYVDVNGDSNAPNEVGRDLFAFNLDRNCTYAASSSSDEESRFDYVVNNNWSIPADPADYTSGN